MSKKLMDTDVSDFLMPGHVWQRPDTQREVVILAIANAHVPEKRRKDYPVTVVYLDDQNRVTSVNAESFIESRVFHSVDGNVELWMERALTRQEVESIDLSAESASEESDEPVIMFHAVTNETAPTIDQARLQEAFLQYECDPDLANGQMRHKLLFDLDVLSEAELRAAFAGEGTVYGSATLNSNINIEWDEFHGVHLVIDHDGKVAGTAVLITKVAVVRPAASTSVEDAELKNEVTKPAAADPKKAAPARPAAKATAKPAPKKTVAKADPTPEQNAGTEGNADSTGDTGDTTEQQGT